MKKRWKEEGFRLAGTRKRSAELHNSSPASFRSVAASLCRKKNCVSIDMSSVDKMLPSARRGPEKSFSTGSQSLHSATSSQKQLLMLAGKDGKRTRTHARVHKAMERANKRMCNITSTALQDVKQKHDSGVYPPQNDESAGCFFPRGAAWPPDRPLHLLCRRRGVTLQDYALLFKMTPG